MNGGRRDYSMTAKTVSGKLTRGIGAAAMVAVLLPVVFVTVFVAIRQLPAINRFEKAIAGADRIVIRDGRHASPEIAEQPVRATITNAAEITAFNGLFRLRASVRGLGECLGFVYPDVDWFRGEERVAAASVYDNEIVYLDGTGAVLTESASKELSAWFAGRGIPTEPPLGEWREARIARRASQRAATQAAAVAAGDD